MSGCKPGSYQPKEGGRQSEWEACLPCAAKNCSAWQHEFQNQTSCQCKKQPVCTSREYLEGAMNTTAERVAGNLGGRCLKQPDCDWDNNQFREGGSTLRRGVCTDRVPCGAHQYLANSSEVRRGHCADRPVCGDLERLEGGTRWGAGVCRACPTCTTTTTTATTTAFACMPDWPTPTWTAKWDGYCAGSGDTTWAMTPDCSVAMHGGDMDGAGATAVDFCRAFGRADCTVFDANRSLCARHNAAETNHTAWHTSDRDRNSTAPMAEATAAANPLATTAAGGSTTADAATAAAGAAGSGSSGGGGGGGTAAIVVPIVLVLLVVAGAVYYYHYCYHARAGGGSDGGARARQGRDPGAPNSRTERKMSFDNNLYELGDGDATSVSSRDFV